MNVLLPFRVFYKTLKTFDVFVMSKSTETVFYAVGRGKQVGIYDSWKECKAQTEGIPNAKYRKFYSYEDAEEFVNFWKNYSTPVKESLLSENLVSKITDCDGSATDGRQWANTEVSFKSMHSSHSLKRKVGNFVLGCDAIKEVHKEGSLQVKPYTSYLSTAVNPNYVSFLNSKANKPLMIPSGIRNGGLSAEFACRNEEREKCKKKKAKSHFQKSSSSISTSLNGLSSNPDMLHISKPFVTSVENSVPSNGSADEGEAREPCPGIPCDDNTEDVLCIGKKEVGEVSCVDSSDQSGSFHNNGPITKVSDKLTLCVSLFASVLKIITQENTSVTEKTINFLESLLRQNIDTNTHVNPQMEPQENIDMICEDTKNFDKAQPIGINTSEVQGFASSEPQSSQLPYAGVQSLPSQLSSAKGRRDEKNADILALSLRLDSFEKRFDACLKEIGAIAAEISHIKSDIKDLKESASSTPNKRPACSPNKAKDGRVQTTLCFDSDSAKNTPARTYSGKGSAADSEALEVKEGRPLKRKLSRSNSSEKSKRFADDDIDDLLSKIKTEKVDYTSFTLDEDEYVEVYTDGSALSNGKGGAKAGIGIWFGDNHPLNVAQPVVGPPTNNTAEIQAARVAIQLAIKAGITKLKIHTDSEFLINCATKWIHRWKTNGWTLRDGGPVKNKKELEKLDKVASKISVLWEKVPAHSNIKGNETADRLANEGAARIGGGSRYENGQFYSDGNFNAYMGTLRRRERLDGEEGRPGS